MGKRLTRKQRAAKAAAFIDEAVPVPPADRQLAVVEPPVEATAESEPPFDPGEYHEEPRGPWRGRMRPLKVYPQEGLAMVDDDRTVGVQADEDKRLSKDEQEEARREGFTYSTTPRRAYLADVSPENRERAEKLVDRLAEQRREGTERVPF